MSHVDIMLAQRSFETQSKWVMTVAAHGKIRELHRGYPPGLVTTAMSIKKVVGGRHGRPRHLVIDNSEPPETPLCAAVAGQASMMDLFGFEVSA